MQLPNDFKQKYQNLLGIQASEFFSSFQKSATAGFRLNPLKVNKNLINEDCSQPINLVVNGYYGKINGLSIDHLAGWIYSQDPSAMNVAQLADPQSDERVLDLCAAPGGKTTQLAALMKGQGLLVANEINHQRARILSSNVERWGLQNVVVTNNSPAELVSYYPEYFDCIVVDAPCSGEGLFRKDPTAMQYWSLEYVQKCAQRQRQILIQAIKMLRPGGRLIYSTCTFAPEENEQNINWLVQNYPLKIRALPHSTDMDYGRPEWGENNESLTNAIRLFPHHYHGEGHFICKLQKNTITTTKQAHLLKKRRSEKLPDMKLWEDFVNQNLQKVNFASLFLNKNVLYNVVQNWNSYQKQPRIIRNGLKLGEFKKNRFEPDHALVMALKYDQFQQVINLNNDQFQHFIHGEALSVEMTSHHSGWVAVSFEQKIFSWGKLANNQLKNFYPKGLRQ